MIYHLTHYDDDVLSDFARKKLKKTRMLTFSSFSIIGTKRTRLLVSGRYKTARILISMETFELKQLIIFF